MSNDANSWLLGGGVASAKFDHHGDQIKGVITEEPDLRQQTDFDSGQPKFWDDGKPMMQLVVTLSTDQRDPSNSEDDGTRRLYVKGKLQQAVASAIRKAGAKGLEVGGTLTVTYIGDDEPKRRGMSGAKLYTADYVPAAASFLTQPEPATTSAAPPAQRSNGTAAADQAAANANLLANLSPEQIAALQAMQGGQKVPF